MSAIGSIPYFGMRSPAAEEDAAGDPYGYAIEVIGRTLNFVLDDGISGSMGYHEHRILSRVAEVIQADDPMSYEQFMGSLGPR